MVLGWPLFLAGLVTLISLMFVPFSASQTVARAITLGSTLMATTAGLVLMIEGRRTKTYWVCSACQNPLSSPDALICTGCKTELQ